MACDVRYGKGRGSCGTTRQCRRIVSRRLAVAEHGPCHCRAALRPPGAVLLGCGGAAGCGTLANHSLRRSGGRLLGNAALLRWSTIVSPFHPSLGWSPWSPNLGFGPVTDNRSWIRLLVPVAFWFISWPPTPRSCLVCDQSRRIASRTRSQSLPSTASLHQDRRREDVFLGTCARLESRGAFGASGASAPSGQRRPQGSSTRRAVGTAIGGSSRRRGGVTGMPCAARGAEEA